MIEIDTGTDELLCHIDQRVGVITLNKPHKKLHYTQTTLDDRVRVPVLATILIHTPPSSPQKILQPWYHAFAGKSFSGRAPPSVIKKVHTFRE